MPPLSHGSWRGDQPLGMSLVSYPLKLLRDRLYSELPGKI